LFEPSGVRNRGNHTTHWFVFEFVEKGYQTVFGML